MARREGTLKLSSNIEPRAAAPLDSRTVVPTLADLTASGAFPYPYVGMIVSVQSEGKAYMLTADDTTDSSNWEAVGSGEDTIFKGTTDEWDALSVEEQAQYNVKMITDDSDTGEVVDSVTDGDMRAVTSNAVYDALSNVVVTTADVVADGNMNPVTSNAVYDFCDEKWLDISSYFTTVYSKSSELLNPSITVKLSNRGFIKIRFYFDLNVSNTSRQWLACALETPNTQEARDELRGKIRDFSEYIYTILYVNKRGISEKYMEIVTEPGPATLSNTEVRLSPNRTSSLESTTLLAYVNGDFFLAISSGTHTGGWSNERTFKI